MAPNEIFCTDDEFYALFATKYSDVFCRQCVNQHTVPTSTYIAYYVLNRYAFGVVYGAESRQDTDYSILKESRLSVIRSTNLVITVLMFHRFY